MPTPNPMAPALGSLPRYRAELLRSALPEVCWVPDLALVLQVAKSTARRLVKSGALGQYGRLGRRIYCRRATLLAALAEREVAP